VPFPNDSTDFYRVVHKAAIAVQNDRPDIGVDVYVHEESDIVTPLNRAGQNEAVFVVNDRGGSCRIPHQRDDQGEYQVQHGAYVVGREESFAAPG
jgi:hypothetical protein